MAKKESAAFERAEKKAGIKEGSKRDKALDKPGGKKGFMPFKKKGK